ncbi:BZ3500_MvSof-1268-A1-R1_Chr11-1g03131 [Microbotryum saponariae]|uniref:BZ3500_MvSof-1268-A1-R1_Chr11-1g03131 protein n=1 Tax=Microbotryum saponariae TaxID=289078 RepID=A0A2X0LR25_9BASI|nr:BZ3500_MvSof-1268-A1-R1_Chr8-1g09724 [Microbotryum saponariae]SDA02741.1 BZ3501_MvSof-1269-A2-R1_Chr11g02706 [Microbotryum saponariae]SDA03691.1 BZ3500_MvSof-1268-A1-R1_Chr11-1g03131 [Microbotryum saponariae]SDA08010.1 BZ3501_MvSof-1269-A2-R1_Chr8-1g09447 [Microbotryum saponariae]
MKPWWDMDNFTFCRMAGGEDLHLETAIRDPTLLDRVTARASESRSTASA